MDEVELDPPVDDQQDMNETASETSSLSSMSTASTLSTSSPKPSTSTAASECGKNKCRAREKPAANRKQKLPPHGGKLIYYECEKCRHMALSRSAYNEHAQSCYGRDNLPRDQAIIDVQAARFSSAPVMGTCIYCEKFAHCVGPILLCHEYICGERQWRGEVGDPPYIPALKLWYKSRTCRIAPPRYRDALEEFKRGGSWETIEREYLTFKRLEYLLPRMRDVNEKQPLPRRVTSRPDVDPPIMCEEKNVAMVRPLQSVNRRRYKERLINRHLEPACCTLMGSVYSLKRRGVVGHLVMVGEPRFGVLTLEPMNEAHDKVTMFYRSLGHTKPAPFRRPLAATIALYDVKTGRCSGFLETVDNPREWETDYTIVGDLDHDAMRCPGISVTYTEIPTELLKLFTADMLSPVGLRGRTQ